VLVVVVVEIVVVLELVEVVLELVVVDEAVVVVVVAVVLELLVDVVVLVVVSSVQLYVVGVHSPSAPHTTVCDPVYPGAHVSSARSPNTPVVVFVVPCGGSCGDLGQSTGMQVNRGVLHSPSARHVTVVQSPDPLSDPDALSESLKHTTRYPVRQVRVAWSSYTP
jgi:hypothetical protein